MSSKTVKKKIHDSTKDQISKKRPINIKELTVPFSELLDHVKPLYIYNGNEEIPFKKRHPEYQTIFQYEFGGDLRKFFEKINYFYNL